MGCTADIPFFMCTREKDPWCEFAVDAVNGRPTKFLAALAKKYNMVIVNPILERDEAHQDTIHNTAGTPAFGLHVCACACMRVGGVATGELTAEPCRSPGLQ